jgi:hypothetical protein
MHRFGPSHGSPAPGLDLPVARDEAERQTRYSWVLVVLLSLATITVALSTSVASHAVTSSVITMK